MTALEYMEKQVHKHQQNFLREFDRKAPQDVLENIRLKIGYYEAAAEALQRVMTATDNNVGGKWIPVSERLPEEDDRYATVCDFGNGVVTRGVCGFAKDFSKVATYQTNAKNVWYEYDREYGFVMITYVTHWMPLPEPPKEET